MPLDAQPVPRVLVRASRPPSKAAHAPPGLDRMQAARTPRLRAFIAAIPDAGVRALVVAVL